MFIKVQFLIFVLGAVPFTALAEEASSVLEEEESATIDFRDRNNTELVDLPILLPTRLDNVTSVLQFGQLMTTESAFTPLEDSGNSTGYKANTENADAIAVANRCSECTLPQVQTEKSDHKYWKSARLTGGLSREPEKTEKGGLETIALVGIIVGIIVAVGILAGIIIAVVRKMSGRYSP